MVTILDSAAFSMISLEALGFVDPGKFYRRRIVKKSFRSLSCSQ